MIRRAALALGLLAPGLLAGLGPASAQVVAIDAPTLVKDPGRWVGRTVRVAALRCANEPKGSFACGLTASGRHVRIEGLALDFRTSTGVRRRLSAQCRTDLASTSEVCVFDAEFTPLSVTAARGSTAENPAVRIKTRRLNLF